METDKYETSIPADANPALITKGKESLLQCIQHGRSKSGKSPANDGKIIPATAEWINEATGNSLETEDE